MRARLASSVGLILSGCHPYQRDPGYASRRLEELLRDPLHHDNVKYSVAVLGSLGLLVALAVVVALVARRARE